MSLVDVLSIPEDVVLDQLYYTYQESYVAYFKERATTTTLTVTGLDAEKYKGDFHGLLLYLGIERKYHYLVTRVNDLTCSTDYDGLNLFVRMPDVSEMGSVLQLYQSLEDE